MTSVTSKCTHVQSCAHSLKNQGTAIPWSLDTCGRGGSCGLGVDHSISLLYLGGSSFFSYTLNVHLLNWSEISQENKSANEKEIENQSCTVQWV